MISIKGKSLLGGQSESSGVGAPKPSAPRYKVISDFEMDARKKKAVRNIKSRTREDSLQQRARKTKTSQVRRLSSVGIKRNYGSKPDPVDRTGKDYYDRKLLKR